MENQAVSKSSVIRGFLAFGSIVAVVLVTVPAIARSAAQEPAGSESTAAEGSAPVQEVQEEEEEWVEGKKGLRYKDLVVGEGEVAERGDTVQVHYTGWLEDGTKFDSSLDRGTAFAFRLGQGRVIRGWELGVEGMREGGKRRLEIPPKLGYGNRSVGPIPPKSTLIFEIELLNVQ